MVGEEEAMSLVVLWLNIQLHTWRCAQDTLPVCLAVPIRAHQSYPQPPSMSGRQEVGGKMPIHTGMRLPIQVCFFTVRAL